MIFLSIFPYCLREIQTLALTLSLIIMCQLYCYKVDNGTTIQGPQCIFVKKALDRSIQDDKKVAHRVMRVMLGDHVLDVELD